MLKKETAVPGARIILNPVLKNGLTAYGGSEVIPAITIFQDAGAIFDPAYQVSSGTELEIVKGPRKVNRINSIRLRVVGTEIEGESYWCEIRSSSRLK
jgi:hypothetical protein